MGVMHINVVNHIEMGRLQRQYCDRDGKLCGGRVLAFYIKKTRTAYCTDVETCVHEFLHYCDSDWGHFGVSETVDIRIDKQNDMPKSKIMQGLQKNDGKSP